MPQKASLSVPGEQKKGAKKGGRGEDTLFSAIAMVRRFSLKRGNPEQIN